MNFFVIISISLLLVSCINSLEDRSMYSIVEIKDSTNIKNRVESKIDSNDGLIDSIVYFPNSKKIKYHFQYKDNYIHGNFKSFYLSNILRMKSQYVKGYQNGIREHFAPSGKIAKRYLFEMGCLSWKEYYDKNGILFQKEFYNKNQIYMSLLYNENNVDTSYTPGKGKVPCERYTTIESLK